jgi:hypothetical protein
MEYKKKPETEDEFRVNETGENKTNRTELERRINIVYWRSAVFGCERHSVAVHNRNRLLGRRKGGRHVDVWRSDLRTHEQRQRARE